MTAQIEALAAAMWRAEAVDSGTPASVAAGRTPEAFADAGDEVRAKWHKFAKVVEPFFDAEQTRIVRLVYKHAHEQRQTLLGDRIIAEIRHPERFVT